MYIVASPQYPNTLCKHCQPYDSVDVAVSTKRIPLWPRVQCLQRSNDQHPHHPATTSGTDSCTALQIYNYRTKTKNTTQSEQS